MKNELSLNSLPRLFYANFRYFLKGEKHVTRCCGEDVLLMVFDGKLRFSENGVPVELTKGEYYIQRRGLYQQGLIPSENPHYFYIHFVGEWDEEVRGLAVRGRFSLEEFMPLMEQMAFLERTEASVTERCAAFYSILSRLLQYSFREFTFEDKRRLVQKMIRYMTENFSESVSLADLSKEFSYSKNYIIRIFSEVMDQTPMEYRRVSRMRQAERLLSDSSLSAEQISQICGFSTYACFYKEFRRFHEISPSRWRNQS